MYQNGYSPQELFSWRLTVYKNSLESAQALIAARHKLDVKWTNKDNIEYAQRILQYHISNELSFRLSQDIVHAIDSIWRDPAIQEVVERGGSEYYLMDSAPYFFNEIRRLGDSNYVPNEADVLRARLKSTGITDTRFNMGQLSIQCVVNWFNQLMFDVGGQRSERKKWIHCFESVTSIIFCVALSEYDQVLLEEAGQ
ncbi:guanine nucleotide binding protein, alpha subunit, partial [Jimgerdemannia flammicorona]